MRPGPIIAESMVITTIKWDPYSTKKEHLMKKVSCIAATCTALAILAAPAAQAQSLSAPGEKNLFSCEVGKKVLSVCGSKDLDSVKGVMQYRFGTPEKIELAHPEKPEHPAKHFTANRLYSSAESSLIMELGFKRGAIGYTVYTEEIRGKKGAGVTVNIKGKDTELKCKDVKGTASFASEITDLNLPEPK